MGRQRRRGSGVKWLNHYSSAQSILVIGDGDMSFSLALAAAFGSGDNLVATSLDSYDALTSKYGKAESNVIELGRLGATVFHGVDAKMMKRHPCLKMRRFDRIVFNFPHAGFIGPEYEDHVIKAHQLLVRRFFRNASPLLHPDGEIHVSHKTGQPYDRWQVEEIASEFSLVISEVVTFRKEDYPGYNQKRGDGEWCDKGFPLLNGCTFKFRVEQHGEADGVQTESLHRLQESLDDVTKLHQEKEQQLLLLQQELNSISGSLRSCEHERSTLESRLEEEERRSQHRLQESLDAVTKLRQKLLLFQRELTLTSESLRSCEHARSTLWGRLEEEQRRSRKFKVLLWSVCILFLIFGTRR